MNTPRFDILSLMKNSEDEDINLGASPCYQELCKQFTKWSNDFQRRSTAAVQHARFQWTEDLYKKYRDIPVEELILSDYFFGLEGQIYPIHFEEVSDVFNWWREGRITEAIDISAWGTGKSFKMGLLAGLLTFDTLIHPEPATMYGLSPKTNLAMAVMSRTHTLAREITFMQMLPFFDCPFFNDYFPPQVNLALIEETRKFPNMLRFPKRFAIFPGTGSSTSTLGWNLLFGILDEFAWMEKVTQSKRGELAFGSAEYDAAFEVYSSIDTRIFSRTYAGDRKGFIFMGTSPRSKWDFAEEKYKEGVRNREKIKNNESLIPTEDTLVREATDEEKKEGKTEVYDASLKDTSRTAKPIVALKRKSMWRAKPFIWKGKKQWSGKYLLFNPTTMLFESDQVFTGLFDNEEDVTEDGFLKVPIELVERFKENPHRALRDLAALCTTGISPFFTNIGKIKTRKDLPNYAIRRGNKKIALKEDYTPDNHVYKTQLRYSHGDLAKNRDVAAVATCFCKGWKISKDRQIRLPIARFDFLHEVYPRAGETDIRIEDVVNLIIETENRGFKMGLVTFDQFQSLNVIQTLWDSYGIPANVLSIDHTAHRVVIAGVKDKSEYGSVRLPVPNAPLSAWIAFREAFYDDRIEVPEYEKTDCSLMQMIEQEEIYPNMKSGKGVVDHPAGGKHDLLQALVGAYWNMLNNEWWAGEVATFKEDDSEIGETASIDRAIRIVETDPEILKRLGLW